MNKKYLYIAIVVSPFLGTLISNLLNALLIYSSSPKPLFNVLLESVVPALYGGLFFGLPTIIILGLPVYFLLNKLNLQKPWVYISFGFIVSMFIVLLLSTKNTQPLNASDIPAVAMFGVHGISVALVFWYFAIYLRDRSKNSSNNSFNPDGADNAPSG